MIVLFNFLAILIQALTLAIFVRALLSWFPISPENPIAVILVQVTEPILGPLRKVVPMIGMMDITPLVAIILLQLVSQVVGYMAYSYY